MQKILKSLLVMVIALGVGVGATGAYFTSTVTAANNQIVAGTLALSIDSSDTVTNGGIAQVFGLPYSWQVAYQTPTGTVQSGTPFTPWTAAAPGDTNNYYVAIRNLGNVPAQVKSSVTGRWVSGPRFGTTLPDNTVCPLDGPSADPTLVSVTNVRQFATGNCLGETGCENLYYGLTNTGYTNASGIVMQDNAAPTGTFYSVTSGTPNQANVNRVTFGSSQFAIYRVTAALSGPNTNDCYQGATYTFDLTSSAKQVNDPNPAW